MKVTTYELQANDSVMYTVVGSTWGSTSKKCYYYLLPMLSQYQEKVQYFPTKEECMLKNMQDIFRNGTDVDASIAKKQPRTSVDYHWPGHHVSHNAVYHAKANLTCYPTHSPYWYYSVAYPNAYPDANVFDEKIKPRSCRMIWERNFRNVEQIEDVNIMMHDATHRFRSMYIVQGHETVDDITVVYRAFYGRDYGYTYDDLEEFDYTVINWEAFAFTCRNARGQHDGWYSFESERATHNLIGYEIDGFNPTDYILKEYGVPEGLKPTRSDAVTAVEALLRHFKSSIPFLNMRCKRSRRYLDRMDFGKWYRDSYAWNVNEMVHRANVELASLKKAHTLNILDMSNERISFHCVNAVGMMNSNNIQNLRELAEGYDGVKSLVKTLKGLPSSKIKGVAQAYLSVHYGLKLTILNLQDLYTYCNETPMWGAMHGAYSSTNENYSSHNTTRGTLSYDNSKGFRDIWSEFLDRIDFKLDLANFWDITPWSFVIDWFVSVGDVLTAVDNWFRIQTKYDLLGFERTDSSSRIIDLSDRSGLAPGSGIITMSTSVYYRRAWEPEDVPKPIPSIEDLDSTSQLFNHWLEAAALYVSNAIQ